jgi:hypothetical protein
VDWYCGNLAEECGEKSAREIGGSESRRLKVECTYAVEERRVSTGSVGSNRDTTPESILTLT